MNIKLMQGTAQAVNSRYNSSDTARFKVYDILITLSMLVFSAYQVFKAAKAAIRPISKN